MHKNIAVLAGDGIGPEIITEAIKVLQAIGKKHNHSFSFENALMGAVAIDATGNPLPEKTIEICKSNDAILFGVIGDPKYDNDPNAKVRPEQGLLSLRKTLNLYCNVRPVTIYDRLIESSPLKRDRIEGVDLVGQYIEIPSIDLHIDFEINSYKKTCLINGYDDIDYLINNKHKIEQFERKRNA